MKRKEPTAKEEDEESRLLWEEQEQEQEEEPSSDFLSALPDLALSAVLDFLQQQQRMHQRVQQTLDRTTLASRERIKRWLDRVSRRQPAAAVSAAPQQEGASTLRVDDEDSCSSLPELWRLRTLHGAFVDHALFLHRYDEQSEEPSPEEWAAYKNELVARPKPEALLSCAEHMESYEPGGWASPSLLALRLTCHSVKRAVEAVARRGLFPQFELFTSVDRWLTWRVAWPTLVVAASPEEAQQQHLIREVESAAIACANARMHQLRLDACLDVVFGETSEKRASLAQTLNYELSGNEDDGRARLRVEYMTHGGNFLGCEAGMGLESCLSLSLPGQPHEVIRILCSAQARWDQDEELEVYLDLHTNSPAWSKALGLVPAEQQSNVAGATSLTDNVAGTTKPLLTWQAGFSAENRLLGEIWRALGFTTNVPAHGRRDKEKASGVVWDRAWMETALLACLGWSRDETPRSGRWVTATLDGRQPYVTKWLRQAERFLQRKAVLDEASGFFADHVDPLLAQLERRPQKLRGLRHVRRAIGQFFGQRRIALVGPALESLRKTRAGTTPDPVRSGRQVAESTQTFLGALRFVEGRSISTELMDDQKHPFTSSSVRWMVRIPGATTNTTNHHRTQHTDAGDDDDHNGNDDQPRSGKRRRVGLCLGTSSSAPIEVDSDSEETRGGASGKLVFSYDRTVSVRYESSPNAWHERLAVRAVMPDHHQQLEGLSAGEEHELYVSQCIDDADPREVMSYAMLADIGRLLGLRPTATASSLASHEEKEEEEEEEEARFGEEVANLLVMVAKVAMWDAHVTLPSSCAFNQELVDHLDCIAKAEMDHRVADSADHPPPPPPSSATGADSAGMAAVPASSASVQFVEDYLREPWPVS